MPAITLDTPQAQSWYTSPVTNLLANNWVTDAAGNIQQVALATGGRNFTYDAENRQATSTITLADGQRYGCLTVLGKRAQVGESVRFAQLELSHWPK